MRRAKGSIAALKPIGLLVAATLWLTALNAANSLAASLPGFGQATPLPVQMFASYAKGAGEFRILYRAHSDVGQNNGFFEYMTYQIPYAAGMRAEIYSLEQGPYAQQQTQQLGRFIRCPFQTMSQPHGLDILARGKGLTLVLDDRGGSAVLGEKALLQALRTVRGSRLYLVVFKKH
ncbi:MAG: hypothetical protein Q4G66_10795 [bacterium]|nr:hypothetical protein [bacterium]